MFDQIVDWMSMAVTVAEGLLVGRILGLKLYRMYAFLTLFCVLNLFFDAVSWWLGWKSQETERVEISSLFLFAALAPFAVWDVFEELKPQISKLLRLQAVRLVSGLLITAICGTILGFSFDLKDAQGNSAMNTFLAVFLWTGSASACLTFLWFTYRLIRLQKIELPHNTFVWAMFLLLYLTLSILDCMSSLLRTSINATASDVSAAVLALLEVVLIGWCILRLRPVASHAPAHPSA